MNGANQLKVRLPKFTRRDLERENANDPNLWFAKMFPASAEAHGPAFLQATFDDNSGLTHFHALELNIDFFAHALGGDRAMGHRVVFYEPEECWYFNDPRIGCFCPTTEQKLEALISSYLVRCAQDAGSLVDIRRIFSEFRRPETLKGIITRAKSLLLADGSFFQGAKGQKRMIGGKIIDPLAAPAYVQFVKTAIVREPEAKLTVASAFHQYFAWCKEHGEPPLTRADFKELASEVIRAEYRLGIRHDLLDERGKAQHGWLGIACRLGHSAVAGQN